MKKLLAGLIIGIASMMPGLSGGVIAAALGLYEPSVHAIVSVRREPRKSVKYLLPLGVGAGIGMLLFSSLMKGLMTASSVRVTYAFIGLVAGSLPFLVNEATRDGFRPKHLWVLGIAFAIVLGFEWARGLSTHVAAGEFGFLNSMLYGVVLAIGTIVPGISSSLVLMQLGAYEGLLSAVIGIDLSILVPFGIGFVIAALPMVKLVDVLFKQRRAPSYFGVIGFLAGSIIVSFPGFRSGTDFLGDVALLLLGIAASFLVTRVRGKGPLSSS